MHFSVKKLKIGGINVEASIKYGWAIGKTQIQLIMVEMCRCIQHLEKMIAGK